MPSRDRFIKLPALAAVLISAIIAPRHVRAGNVTPMSVKRMADHAGQVIVGTVAAKRSYWAANPRRIESEVTLRYVTYLKGRRPASRSTFTLTVPGGKAGSTEMKIGCAPDFLVGEKWLLFLLPTYKTFPVVGIAQGALRLEADENGVERVFTSGHEAVVGLDSAGLIRSRKQSGGGGAVRGHAAHTGAVRNMGERMTVGSIAVESRIFIQEIQPAITSSGAHQLTASAGQRAAAVVFTPARLARSAGFSARQDAGVVDGRSFARRTPAPTETTGPARTPAQ